MKSITQDYKTNIKEIGRELDTIISYTSNGNTVELGVEELNSASLHYEGDILKSVMKQLDLDSNVDIPLETQITAQFGVKVNGTYEYINLGNFIVYSSEKQEDLSSYKIVCYDKLLYSMKNYEGNFDYELTEDTEFDINKTYYELDDDEYVEYTGSIYNLTEDSEFVENKKYYELIEDEYIEYTGSIYSETEDTEFVENKTYYEFQDDEFVEYSGDRSGDPNELGLYEMGNPSALGLYELGNPSELSLYEYKYISLAFPMTIRDYITLLCSKIGLTFANENDTFPNYNKMINDEYYLDGNGNSLNYIYRDIFDDLSQVTASTICINNDDELELRYINNTQDTINEEYFKDTNVNFSEVFGPINTVTFKRSADSDVISLSNPIDLSDDLKNEIVISDNQILNLDNRADYLEDILTQLYGLSYSLNDYSSTGITYYELCDKYNVVIGNNTYTCIMLNDEINITQGLEENVHTNLPSESDTDYNTTARDDRTKLRTELIVNKQEGKITGLVSEQNDLDKRLDEAELKLTSQGLTLELKTSKIDNNGNTTSFESNGMLYELTEDATFEEEKKYYIKNGDLFELAEVTIGDTIPSNTYYEQQETDQLSYTMNIEGFITEDKINGYKSVRSATGDFFYDNNKMKAKYTKEGSVQQDLSLFGKYYYGIDENLDVANFKKDDAMFISQTFIDENGVKCVGHFYNGGGY